MTLHHPAKIIAIHGPDAVKSADSSVQATLEMWDENVLTLTVEPKIAKDVKPGDTVLVDYTPLAIGKRTVQRQVVVKVLAKPTGEQIWKTYKDYYQKLKGAKAAKATAAAMQAAQSAEYFG